MTKYFTIACNGFQGCCYYATKEEAEQAAASRNALHGHSFWQVCEVWLNDPYAADERPYLTRLI